MMKWRDAAKRTLAPPFTVEEAWQVLLQQ